MKKSIIRVLSLSIAAACALISFAACGNTDTPAAGSDTVASTDVITPVSTEEVTTEKLDDYGRPYLEANIPANLDYKGREYTVHTRGNVEQYEWKADDENGETLNDAIFKRNTRVETELNIKLNIVAEGSWSNYNNELLPKIKASITAGDGAYDLLAGYGNVTSLATEGLVLNLSNLQYVDFDQPWWSASFKEATEINGANYFAVGALSLSMIYSMECIFVNTTLLSEVAGDNYNIYQDVKDKKWTFEALELLAQKAWVDTNNNGVADAGDVVGFSYPTASNATQGFFYSSGTKLITKNSDGELSLDQIDVQKTGEILEAVIKIMYTAPGVAAGNTESTILFQDGQTLFNFRWLYWGQTLYAGAMETYGIIPVPMVNAEQDNYHTAVQGGMHMYCIPRDVNSIEEDSIILEALAAESYRSLMPAYFEVVLKSRYSKDAQTSQIMDLLYETVDFDFGFIYRSEIPYWSSISELISYKNANFSAAYKTVSNAAKTSLKTLLKAYEANEK